MAGVQGSWPGSGLSGECRLWPSRVTSGGEDVSLSLSALSLTALPRVAGWLSGAAGLAGCGDQGPVERLLPVAATRGRLPPGTCGPCYLLFLPGNCPCCSLWVGTFSVTAGVQRTPPRAAVLCWARGQQCPPPGLRRPRVGTATLTSLSLSPPSWDGGVQGGPRRWSALSRCSWGW